MPFSDMWKLPQGFKPPVDAVDPMEGLNGFQKFNYQMQYNKPSMMALSAGLLAGDMGQGFADMGKQMGEYQEQAAKRQEIDLQRSQMKKYLLDQGLSEEQAEAGSINPAIAEHMFELDTQAQKAALKASGSDMESGFSRQMVRRKKKDGTWEVVLAAPDNMGRMLINGQPVDLQAEGWEPYDPYTRELEKAAGKSEGEIVAQAPAAISFAEHSLASLAEIEADPALPWATGMSGPLANAVWGSPGYDFANKVKQLKAQSFLNSIQSMQGFGALSNQEGESATAAANRLDTATSEPEFRAALAEVKGWIEYGKKNAELKLAKYGHAGNANPPYQPAPGGQPSVVPQGGKATPGAVRTGKTKGGLPFTIPARQ